MKTATEMFEQLGYKEISSSNNRKVFKKDNLVTSYTIVFEYGAKTINIYSSINGHGFNSKDMTMQELKAINKQVEELGWFDE